MLQQALDGYRSRLEALKSLYYQRVTCGGAPRPNPLNTHTFFVLDSPPNPCEKGSSAEGNSYGHVQVCLENPRW